MFKRIWKDEDGQGMVEYGLIIAFVAITVIAALILFGDEIVAMFGAAADGINSPDWNVPSSLPSGT